MGLSHWFWKLLRRDPEAAKLLRVTQTPARAHFGEHREAAANRTNS